MSFSVNENVLFKGWEQYHIMHRERCAATIYENGRCEIHDSSLLPFYLYIEDADDLDTRVNNLNNFIYWCASRVLTLDRRYVKEILNCIHAFQAVTDRDRARIALSYHCLSLTDVYWVKGAEEHISFADINLFQHSLSGAFVDVSLLGRNLTAENMELLTALDAAGDLSTQGVAPKAWIRDEGVFYLLKDGEERDVEAELLASRICDCFQVEHVAYEPALFEGKRVSRSRLITSLERSIVPIQHVEIYCVNHDLSTEQYILQKDTYQYHMMNVMDYLTGNTDRHWGNWGFWVDNQDNRITRLHPLMDFNKAFQAYDTLEGGRCQTTRANLSQREAAERGVKAVGLNQVSEIPPSLFTDETWRKMFFQRLEVLRKVAKEQAD